MHVIQPSEIESINVLGDVELSYIGFGDESKITRSLNPYYYIDTPDLQPAPPVGFNLTFICPEGQV